MLKNYLTVALRNLFRNKIFSAINILGLSIGISSALVIYLIVHYDFSFDRFEPGGDRIYRVVAENAYQGNIGHTRGVPAPLGEAVHKELSGIEETAAFRYYNVQKTVITAPRPGQSSASPSSFKAQTNVIFADGHYFNLLPYRWLAGSPGTALAEPGRVVLDQSRAALYFPGRAYKDIIGQKVLYDDTLMTTVSGIVADLDARGNTDFSFREFISLATLLDNKWLRDQFYWDQWGSTTSDHQVYVRLAKGEKTATIEAGLRRLFDKYQGASFKTSGFKQTYFLQPLRDIHFNSDYGVFNNGVVSKSVLYGLMLVAAFLLLLGCINFINLTTAQALQRAKEIGIRKTMGSSRWQLIVQFLCETFVITSLATILSLMVTPLLLKAFADFIPKDLHFSMRRPYLLGFGALLVCTVSFLAGFYPALVLSSWQPIKVLKSQVNAGSGGLRKARVRQTLTVLQFVIAQAFVMATLLVSKQISYLLSRDLGFRKEAIFSFSTPYYADTSYRQRLYFVHELQQIPGITRVSLGSDVPSSGGTWSTIIKYEDGKKKTETSVELKCGDTNYLSIFHIPLLAGRAPAPSDTIKEVVINETYMHILGFHRPQDAVGKALNINDNTIPIAGVMKDFYAHPLDDMNFKVAPMAFSEANSDSRQIIVSLPPAPEGKTGWKPVITQIESRFKKMWPGEEFQSAFFDESLAAAYGSEQRIAKLLKWATGITVFISCLGLLGLVIYTTRQRVKEIGVRKVLGASVTNIVTILSKEFVKLVLIAFVLATPLTWWALHQWLDNFAVRTDISWWVFVVSGAGMLFIAFVTLGIQTIRAAQANPVDSLRTE
jgi:putative ABC transport system permease protein